jgi:hypothetical protein
MFDDFEDRGRQFKDLVAALSRKVRGSAAGGGE